MDIATYRQIQPRGKFSENHLKCITRWERRWGYHCNLFPAFNGWTQDQLSIKKKNHEDLKYTQLCLGPIQTRSEAVLCFLDKTKMKA